MPTFGSLFSGIGGLDLGLERAGWKCRWQVEIDGFCRRVLAKHWPDVPRHGDIRELSGDELERVDLIAGGFPCQPVSVAGKRLGQDDKRWLWPEFARLICVVRPRFVLVENVPGLLRRGMEDVLGGLAESGYDAEWECIPAAAFGAPHLRDRLFIVAYATGSILGAQQESEREEVGRRQHALGDGETRSATDADGHSVRPEPLARSWGNGSFIASRDGATRTSAYPQVFAKRESADEANPEPSRGQAWPLLGSGSWWNAKPGVDSVVHGVSPKLVEAPLAALGNAVVPQVAEWIGRRLLEACRS